MAGLTEVKMDYDQQYLLADVQVGRHTRGLVILHSEYVFVTGSVGARVWSGLSKGLTIDAISTEIAADFDVTVERARKDTRIFVEGLERHALVIRRSKP